jgi:ATP-dependent protease ClpP protease subunit
MSEFMPVDIELQSMVRNGALRDRRLFLCDEVTRESIFKVVYYMNRLKDLDDLEEIPMEERKPITIVLDCYGGYVSHGLSLISTIESFKKMGYKIITQCNSVAYSMGFMILIMGSERRMLKYSRCMCHQVSSGTYGEVQSQEEQLEESKRLWNSLKQIIIENTDITMDELDDITKRKFDWYFSAEESLTRKVIDKIL